MSVCVCVIADVIAWGHMVNAVNAAQAAQSLQLPLSSAPAPALSLFLL